MYTPKHFKLNDKKELIVFIKTHSFAVLVNTQNNTPIATHLPFVVEEKAGKLLLKSHMALANAQAIDIDNALVLVLFTGPHAYISPALYANLQNVPTWNYTAAHIYGKVKVLKREEEVFAILESMISFYDTNYLPQWKQLPLQYKHAMLAEIIAFEIEVTDWQAQFKLSQNKSETDKRTIISAFEKKGTETEKQLAEYMKRYV
jgi:transcriptional regulator